MSTYPSFLGEEASVAQDLRGNSPGAARRLVALTGDNALVRSLEALAGGGVDVCVVADSESLSEELLQSHSTIALIDAATVPAPMERFIDALATQFPDLRLLVAGHSGEQNLLSTRIASGRVFRFVHKPASAQRLKLMIDAAGRAAEPQRISVTQTLQTLPDPEEVTGRNALRPARPANPLLLFGGAAALFVAAAMVWFLAFGESREKSVVATSPASPADEAPVQLLVRRADQAFADARYVASDGTSSAELYRDVLKLDAGHARARSGYERSIEIAMRGAEESLLAGNVDQAAVAAEMVRLVAPGNSRLEFLQAQIDRERTRASADASQRVAIEARQAQVRGNLSQFAARLRSGALLDPVNDSAIVHFRSAEAVNPADPTVRSARDELVAALLNAADTQIVAGSEPRARRFIDAAATINSGAPGLDPLRRRAEELAAAASIPSPAAPMAAAPPTAPSPVAAVAVAPSLPTASPATAAIPEAEVPTPPVSANALRRLSAVDPVYPTLALDQLVSGWVELEFTVTPQGRVADVRVITSEPAKTFDNAAMAALRRWRYAPVMRDGEAVSQRARLRMRFSARQP